MYTVRASPSVRQQKLIYTASKASKKHVPGHATHDDRMFNAKQACHSRREDHDGLGAGGKCEPDIYLFSHKSHIIHVWT